MLRLVWFILLSILVILNLLVFVNGINLSCDKCVMEFKNTHVSGVELNEPQMVANLTAQQMYNDIKQGVCSVRWSKTQGYTR